MMRTVATLLLMLQFRPVALALASCAAGLRHVATCEMAAQPRNAPAHHGSSHHGTVPGSSAPGCDCAAALRCNAGTVVSLPSIVGAVALGASVPVPLATALESPDTANPVAPPVPPPNA